MSSLVDTARAVREVIARMLPANVRAVVLMTDDSDVLTVATNASDAAEMLRRALDDMGKTEVTS